jgi:type IV secretion system protein VirB9
MYKNILKIIIFFLLGSFFSTASFADEIPITTDSRIKTLVYNPNEIYQLKFHYGYQSYIEFAEKEQIETISIGESFSWRLTPVGQRLFVRPLEIKAHTNMTIITNKRTYQFDIKSGEYDGTIDEQLVYIVRFYYPKAIEEVVKTPLPNKMNNRSNSSAPNIIARPKFTKPAPGEKKSKQYYKIDTEYSDILKDFTDKKNYKYKIAGNKSEISPLKIYDDGNKTFFQFKNNNMIIPSIFAVDLFGNEKPVNYRIDGKFIVVDSVERQFTLRLSDKLSCIFNEKN